MALLDLANNLGLGHAFTAWTIRDAAWCETPAQPPRPGAGVQGGRPRFGELATAAGVETQEGRYT